MFKTKNTNNTKNTKIVDTIKQAIAMVMLFSLVFVLGACVGKDEDSAEVTTEVSTEVTEVATDIDVVVSTSATTTEVTEVSTVATTETTTENTTTSTTEGSANKPTTEATTTQAPATTQAPTTSAPTTTQAPATTQAPTTEAPKPTCNHNWVAQTKVVHHDAVGHMETKGTYIDASGNDYGANPQIVIAGGKECVLVGYDPYYICNACGTKFYGKDYGGATGAGVASKEHTEATGHGSSSTYSDPIYVEVFYKEIAVFVEDKPAYDETITTGYKCSICGDTK